MINKKVLACLLLTGVVGSNVALASDRSGSVSTGQGLMLSQLATLGDCVDSYITQTDTFIRNTGGACSSSTVNFETGPGQRCATIVDPATSSISAACVLTVKTLTTAAVSPLNQGQTFTFSPKVDMAGTSYDQTKKYPNGIVAWPVVYTAATGSNLTASNQFGVTVNFFSKLPSTYLAVIAASA